MPQNRTGYRHIFRRQDRFGVAVNQKDKRFRRDNIPTLFDAVKTLNESGHAQHPLPPSPYELLDEFLKAHRAPSTESTPFGEVFQQLRGPWRRVARASLSRHQLSKLLRARGYQTFKSGPTLKVRGLRL